MKDETLEKIWVFAIGSRGDVQPYVALSAALVGAGYDVTFFCLGESFAQFATSYGCHAVCLGSEPEELIKKNATMMKGMQNGKFLTFAQGMTQEATKQCSNSCKVLIKEIETQGPPDLSLTMMLSYYYGCYLSLYHKVPFLPLATLPFAFNPEQPLLGTPKLPFGLTRALAKIAIGSMYDPAYEFDKNLNAEVTKKHTKKAFIADCLARGEMTLPLLLLQSRTFADILIGDNNNLAKLNTIACGSTVLETNQQIEKIENFGGQEEFEKLQSFIENGPTPVYLGWGSMICKSPEFMVEFCAKAVHHSKQRAIVIGGFAGLSQEKLDATNAGNEVIQYAKENILFVRYAPHEWLFPKVSATVHHGGAGTTTAALRGGKPTIITPVFADQWDFSYLVRKLGVGIGFEKQLQQISWKELGDAIRKATGDTMMQDRATAMGAQLRSENGAKTAKEEIEKYWKDYCLTGKFNALFPSSAGQDCCFMCRA